MRRLFYSLFFLSYFLFSLTSCSVSKKISQQANELLSDSSIQQGHIGISIYDPASEKYLYNHNADKYFIPASNTKLFTLYTGMKYLGDSIIGLRYLQQPAGSTKIFPTGDPTFLHPAFSNQPVFKFLTQQDSIDYCTHYFFDYLGKGWAWDDYQEPYMAQRSEFPIYGNLARIYKVKDSFEIIPRNIEVHAPKNILNPVYEVNLFRQWDRNVIDMGVASITTPKGYYEIPFYPDLYEVPSFLGDTLYKEINVVSNLASDSVDFNDKRLHKIYSQLSDSVFRFMMHHSDNFFAEQTLLMSSLEGLGYFNIEEIIDTVLHSTLIDIPGQPRWVDGSGLSRYNLFTPRDFIYILNKMKNEFGMDRLKTILPTGGEGTLSNYFITDSSFIYAKTGTLSNNSSLSGFLITKKSKLLLFSVLVNNYPGPSTPVRKAVERFVKTIRENN